MEGVTPGMSLRFMDPDKLQAVKRISEFCDKEEE